MSEFDLIVIGAGPGGYPAAIRAAQLGAKVAIIEREWLGGTCLNCGCIPTKTLIAGAELFRQIKSAEQFGIKVSHVEIDYAAMANRKNDVIAKLKHGINALLKMNNVTFFKGAGAFKNNHTITVKDLDDNEFEITGKNIFIATGSKSTIPSFMPQDERIIDSRAFLDLKKLPQNMLVVGGGYIGCELACLAASLGVEVSIIECLPDILTLLDKDIRSSVKKNMKKNLGIKLMTHTEIKDISVTNEQVTAITDNKEMSADLLLVATGRSPVTDGLNLAAAGIHLSARGYITVNQFSQTNIPNIYCIGDVSGRIQLAHAATSQAIYAAEHAFSSVHNSTESTVPGVIFTAPEVAVVGLTETEATAQNITVKTGKFYFRGLGKAMAANETEGLAKIIANTQDQIIGAQCVGPHATDLISEMVLAVREKLTVKKCGKAIHAHPTFSEIWMEAAHALHKTSIHAPPTK